MFEKDEETDVHIPSSLDELQQMYSDMLDLEVQPVAFEIIGKVIDSNLDPIPEYAQ